MTREDSIRMRTWVTEDGRYLTVDQITPDHLLRIEHRLRSQLTHGYDEATGRQIAADFVTSRQGPCVRCGGSERVEFGSTGGLVDCPSCRTPRSKECAADFVAKRANLDYTIELELDAYRSAWLQIIDDEMSRRAAL